jgi:hypothetical protein
MSSIARTVEIASKSAQMGASHFEKYLKRNRRESPKAQP